MFIESIKYISNVRIRNQILAAFLDLEAAFNNMTLQSIHNTLYAYITFYILLKWIKEC